MFALRSSCPSSQIAASTPSPSRTLFKCGRGHDPRIWVSCTSISYSLTMSIRRGIHSLSNELLRDILDLIEADPDRSVSIDRRAYLSVESFRPPISPPPLRAQDIGNFRLSCRRFAELAIPHQFTKVATRFSHAGFERLEGICSRPHLAKHTKKFSYLIPYFFVDGRVLPRTAHASLTDGQVELRWENF